MTKVVWSDPSVKDLDRIHKYVSEDSVTYADALIGEMIEAVDQLVNFPRSGRIVPEFNKEATRELIVGSYRIIYDIVGTKAMILTVIHGSRLLR